MNRYELLEELECAAVRYLRDAADAGAARALSGELLARFLNAVAARWGCHYTVSAANLRTRHGSSPYGFGPS